MSASHIQKLLMTTVLISHNFGLLLFYLKLACISV